MKNVQSMTGNLKTDIFLRIIKSKYFKTSEDITFVLNVMFKYF